MDPPVVEGANVDGPDELVPPGGEPPRQSKHLDGERYEVDVPQHELPMASRNHRGAHQKSKDQDLDRLLHLQGLVLERAQVPLVQRPALQCVVELLEARLGSIDDHPGHGLDGVVGGAGSLRHKWSKDVEHALRQAVLPDEEVEDVEGRHANLKLVVEFLIVV